MHRMGVAKGCKYIYVTRCCFCVKAEISDCVRCLVHLSKRDSCPEFLSVDCVSNRVDELFEKLPSEYGIAAFY